jgi:hypothetical protein
MLQGSRILVNPSSVAACSSMLFISVEVSLGVEYVNSIEISSCLSDDLPLIIDLEVTEVFGVGNSAGSGVSHIQGDATSLPGLKDVFGVKNCSGNGEPRSGHGFGVLGVLSLLEVLLLTDSLKDIVV